MPNINEQGRTLLTGTYNQYREDEISHEAASVSFYVITAVVPLLALLMLLAGALFGQQDARATIVDQVQQVSGERFANILGDVLASAQQAGGTGLFITIVGIVVFIAGSGNVFYHLRKSINAIWEIEPLGKEDTGHKLVERIKGIVLVTLVAVLVLVMIGFTAILPRLLDNVLNVSGGVSTLLRVGNFLLIFAIVTTLVAFTYKYIPNANISWGDAWPGALVTAVLLAVGQILIELYLRNSTVTTTFGFIGSVLAVLVWIYYSMQILLVGAEFTYIYAREYGTPIQAEPGYIQQDQLPDDNPPPVERPSRMATTP
jgi:membrane protein